MKTLDGNLSIYIGEQDVRIVVEDCLSRSLVCDVQVADRVFVQALGKRARVPVTVCVDDLSIIGKKREHTDFVFPMPERFAWGDRVSVAIETAKRECPPGWTPSDYFGSQHSFFTGQDGKEYARCVIRRWVDVEDSEPKEGE